MAIKQKKNISISIRRKDLYFLTAIFIFIIGAGIIIAYNPTGTASPSAFGHSANEVTGTVVGYCSEICSSPNNPTVAYRNLFYWCGNGVLGSSNNGGSFWGAVRCSNGNGDDCSGQKCYAQPCDGTHCQCTKGTKLSLGRYKTLAGDDDIGYSYLYACVTS